MGSFSIKKTKDNKHMFNLMAGNGAVIATSSRYNSVKACEEDIELLKKSAKGAVLEDQTIRGYSTEKTPKFELFKDKAGEFRFNLKDSKGTILIQSEGYTVKASCKNGIASVIKNAPDGKMIYE